MRVWVGWITLNFSHLLQNLKNLKRRVGTVSKEQPCLSSFLHRSSSIVLWQQPAPEGFQEQLTKHQERKAGLMWNSLPDSPLEKTASSGEPMCCWCLGRPRRQIVFSRIITTSPKLHTKQADLELKCLLPLGFSLSLRYSSLACSSLEEKSRKKEISKIKNKQFENSNLFYTCLPFQNNDRWVKTHF